jgi:hypothetical protein
MSAQLAGRFVTLLFLSLTGDGDTSPRSTFETYREGSEFRWRLKDPAGQVLGVSGRGFASGAAIFEELVALRERSGKRYQDPADGILVTQLFTTPNHTLKWRWVLQKDGPEKTQSRLLAESGEEYGSLKEAEAAAITFGQKVPRARIPDPK